MKYKVSLQEGAEFKTVSLWKKVSKKASRHQLPSKLSPLYAKAPGIKAAKYKDLMSLLDFVPPIYHNFYKSLAHNADSTAESDDEEFPDNLPEDANQSVEDESTSLGQNQNDSTISQATDPLDIVGESTSTAAIAQENKQKKSQLKNKPDKLAAESNQKDQKQLLGKRRAESTTAQPQDMKKMKSPLKNKLEKVVASNKKQKKNINSSALLIENLNN